MNTLEQAAQWVCQELAKINSKSEALEHVAAYNRSCAGFFISTAGQLSAKKSPLTRQARHDLAAQVKIKFNLPA